MSFISKGEFSPLLREESTRDREEILIFIKMPDCGHCRDKIARLLASEYWEVSFGYPHAHGTYIFLSYEPKKHPDVNFFAMAQTARNVLFEHGYAVL